MELFFIVVLSTYAVSVSVFAALLYGQQRMMNKMSVEAKRRERREIRKSNTYLEALMQKTGLTLYRRTHQDPEKMPRPSRNIITPSQLIHRQRQEDAGGVKRPPFEQVPPAIAESFLEDAASNGAAEKQQEN